MRYKVYFESHELIDGQWKKLSDRDYVTVFADQLPTVEIAKKEADKVCEEYNDTLKRGEHPRRAVRITAINEDPIMTEPDHDDDDDSGEDDDDEL